MDLNNLMISGCEVKVWMEVKGMVKSNHSSKVSSLLLSGP